jgi:hypothetical protein
MNEKLLEVFQSSVKTAFSRLLSACVMSYSETGLVSFDLTKCRVNVRLGNGHLPDILITFAPLPKAQSRYHYFFKNEYGLGAILKVKQLSSIDCTAVKISSIEDMESILSKASIIIDQNLSDILAGDFSLWPEIKRIAKV